MDGRELDDEESVGTKGTWMKLSDKEEGAVATAGKWVYGELSTSSLIADGFHPRTEPDAEEGMLS